MKQCIKCDEKKLESEFSDTNLGTKRADCKKCEQIYMKQYAQDNKERIKETARLRRQLRKEQKLRIKLKGWDFDL